MVTSPTRLWEAENNFGFIALNCCQERPSLLGPGSKQLGDRPIDHNLEVGFR